MPAIFFKTSHPEKCVSLFVSAFDGYFLSSILYFKIPAGRVFGLNKKEAHVSRTKFGGRFCCGRLLMIVFVPAQATMSPHLHLGFICFRYSVHANC